MARRAIHGGKARIAQVALVAGVLLAGSPLCRAQAGYQSPATSRQTYHVQDPEAEALRSLLVSGQSHMDKREYVAAAADFRQYLAKKPDDAAIHFQLGYAYTALKEPADAAREYAKAAELNPKMAEAQLNLGLTLLETDPRAAAAPLRRAVELMPNQARPEFLLGWALERSGQTADAITEYRAAEKLDGKNFDIHLSLARELLASNQPVDAQVEFQAALGIKPDTSAAQLGLAQCYIAQKQAAQAVPMLQQYLQADPGDDETRVQLAGIFYDTGKLDEATAQLQHVPASSPQAAAAEKLEARIYEQQKNYAQAASLLAQSVKAAPDDAEAHAELGRLELRAKNYPEAAKELGAAFRLNPKDDSILRDLADAHYLAADLAGALNILNVIAQHGALSADEMYLRALCNDKMGHVPEAYSDFETFLTLNKGAETDQYFLAMARARALQSELKNNKK